MVLDFHQLHCFLFILVQFIEVLGLDFLQGVDLTCGKVDRLVDFGVFFA